MAKHLRSLVYFAGFLLSFHLALPAYVSSSFLESFFYQGRGEQIISLIFIAASALALIGINFADRPIGRFGLQKATLGFSLTTLMLGLLLSVTTIPWLAIVFFMAFYAGGFVLKFLLDIYLEDLSSDQATGQIRGLFLTLTNLAWLFSPLLASWVINEVYFGRIYILAALLLLPFIYLVAGPLNKIKEPKYEHASLTSGLKLLFKKATGINRNIRHSLILNFILNLFYAFMVIYMPLYLTRSINLSWQEVGIIFTFMLLPFPLFQYYFGWLADKYFGEKEIMSVGLMIMGITTAMIALVSSQSLILWSLLLFVNRTGTCALEAMTESYFFKQVDGHNVSTIGFFRNVGPLSFIIAPVIATAIFFFYSYQILFILLGAICLYGLRYSLTLQDTK